MDPKRIFEYARETDTILIFNGDENSVDKTFFYLTGGADSGLFEHSARGHAGKREDRDIAAGGTVSKGNGGA